MMDQLSRAPVLAMPVSPCVFRTFAYEEVFREGRVGSLKRAVLRPGYSSGNARLGSEESTYAGIVRLVSEAQKARAPLARLADRYALVFLPLAVAVAALARALSGNPDRALAVLVIATAPPGRLVRVRRGGEPAAAVAFYGAPPAAENVLRSTTGRGHDA